MKRYHRQLSLLLQITVFALLGGAIGIANSDWRKQSAVPGPGGTVVATAVTPDGTRAATVTDDGHVSLWDLTHRRLIRSRHLPYGKPHHLAIRDQADAIAIAYKDADAVIWWCDGSDKLVLPNVRARLVAFAHQKRILAVAQHDGFGSTWDIDKASEIIQTDVSGLYIDGPFLSVLPNDEGAIVYNNSLLGANGFRLESEITIATGGTSMIGIAEEPPVLNPPNNIGIFYHRALGVTFYEWNVEASQRTPITLPKQHIMRPVCAFTSNTSIAGLEAAREYAAISSQPGQTQSVVTGNTTGDLITYQRTQPGDWMKHPAPWLVIPSSLLLVFLLVRRRLELAQQPKVLADPAHAQRPLPRITVVAAWLTVVFGVYSAAQMVYDITTGACMLNIGVLGIPAGVKILKKRNGWRKFAVFLAWVGVLGGALLLGVSWFGQMPLELTLGSSMRYMPIWVGVLVALALLGVSVFMALALTDPRAIRICRAATRPDVMTREQRIDQLSKCPTCGYNTSQTVIDGRYQCPECGGILFFNEEERGWLAERQQQPADPV